MQQSFNQMENAIAALNFIFLYLFQFYKGSILNICNNYALILFKLNVTEQSWEKTVFSTEITYFKATHNND